VIVTLRLTNQSAHALPLHVSTDNFSAYDNHGRRLPFGHVDALYNYYAHGDTVLGYDVVLEPGATINLAVGRSDDVINLFVNVDITDPSLTEVKINISGISSIYASIHNARWRIPIPH